jgi:hypothetical protein
MEAIRSSDTSVLTRTTRPHISEGNEPSSSIKGAKSLDYLCDYRLRNKACGPCSYSLSLRRSEVTKGALGGWGMRLGSRSVCTAPRVLRNAVTSLLTSYCSNSSMTLSDKRLIFSEPFTCVSPNGKTHTR